VTAQVTDRDAAIDRLLNDDRVVQVQVRENMERKLRSGKPLRVKMGFDPSRPDIHLGHYVGIKKMRQFQDLGHTLVVIIGDWTAQIGDPSGRSTQRSMLTAEEVKANAQTYLDQFFTVIDPERAELVWQSSWFGEFNLATVLQLTSRFTVARMLERDDFQKRYGEGSPIAIVEFLYPLLQAYDSVAVRADIELGGTDQTFNLLVGRDIQREYGQDPQDILTMPLLVGTDGIQKMSKSLDNYVGITEDPIQSYGKLMSIPDTLIENYLRLATDLPRDEIATLISGMADGSVNPRDAKDRMATEVVRDLHGEEAAQDARAEFDRVFRSRELPSDMPEQAVAEPMAALQLLVSVGLAASNNEARRLIEQGGVRLDGERVESGEQMIEVREPVVIQVGRRRFMRLLPSK
jgi:tyrosyl-tRNA synthetase